MKNGTICLPMAPFVVLVGVAGLHHPSLNDYLSVFYPNPLQTGLRIG